MSQAKGAAVAAITLIIGVVIGLFIPFGQVAPTPITETKTIVTTQPITQTALVGPQTVSVTTVTLILYTGYPTTRTTRTQYFNSTSYFTSSVSGKSESLSVNGISGSEYWSYNGNSPYLDAQDYNSGYGNYIYTPPSPK